MYNCIMAIPLAIRHLYTFTSNNISLHCITNSPKLLTDYGYNKVLILAQGLIKCICKNFMD